MNIILQKEFKKNPQMYEYLKRNSYYFKELDLGLIDFKTFSDQMKIKYKKRVTDKLQQAVDKIDLFSSVLDVLK